MQVVTLVFFCDQWLTVKIFSHFVKSSDVMLMSIWMYLNYCISLCLAHVAGLLSKCIFWSHSFSYVCLRQLMFKSFFSYWVSSLLKYSWWRIALTLTYKDGKSGNHSRNYVWGFPVSLDFVLDGNKQDLQIIAQFTDTFRVWKAQPVLLVLVSSALKKIFIWVYFVF